jgi:hypothetical protein
VGISPKHNATRALAAGLAAAAIAPPSALADDQCSPEARDATTPVAQTEGARTPDAPTVVEITSGHGFDWTSAGIGAGGGIALALIAIAATATVSNRSPPTPH